VAEVARAVFEPDQRVQRADALHHQLQFERLAGNPVAWLDVFGAIFFLMPMAIIIAWMSIPMVVNSFRIWEHSSDPGGLLRWPIKIAIPIGFVLLAVQGVAEIIKKYAVATGVREPGKAYERPVQ
jgi:TRAP-type mannitol/chloroaromatic compound transport system permease small subunit